MTASSPTEATLPSPSNTAPAAIALPACEAVSEELEDDDLLSLLAKDRMVRALAEQGLGGVREIVREEEAKGGRFAERVASLRERLRRQFSRQVHHLQQEYRRKEDDLRLRQEDQRRLLEAEIARLQESLQRARELSAPSLKADQDLMEAVRSALLLPTDALKRASRERPPSLWQRIRAFFSHLWQAILRLFGRGKRAEPRRKPSEGRTVTIGRLASFGRTLSPDNAGDLFGQLTPAQMKAIQDATEQRLRDRTRDLTRQGKESEVEVRRRRDDLAREAEAARAEALRRAEEQTRAGVEKKVRDELKERGWVRERSGQMAITYALVEKFARLVLEEESRSLPEGLRMSLKGSASTGLYEKGRLRQLDEVARLDLVGSLVESRLRGSRHLIEDASYVYREIRSESLHAVLLLDTSGSMAEGEKLPAAKKAFLALYMAIRRRYPDAVLDVVAFDNNVRVLDLVSLWEARPGAFTNTGEALRTAHELLRSSRAHRKEVYLITDGLPEAYSEETGEVKSGNLQKALESALQRATELRTVGPLASTIVLLKSEDPSFEKAARALARVLGGSVVITDPRRLAFELLVRFIGDQPMERAAPAGPSEPTAPHPPAASASAPTVGVSVPGGTARDRRKARRASGGGGTPPSAPSPS
ncbi:MAG: VWA domain-containing protein [Euryarchaeota archaeon]|nr:VWA domain-containing protein [Euryarchaeota archaeon]MDE1836799.1 VWA domain-containing protein [Euryarchaeota archaeon]MDE1881116.1 VWA domain-containing protein [Euryarchaeota archaeon]MDE2044783.1 VWA domain-containing protein [Thermoplasmata archaeon]